MSGFRYMIEHAYSPARGDNLEYHPISSKGTLQKPCMHFHHYYEICLILSGNISVITEKYNVQNEGMCLVVYKTDSLHAQFNKFDTTYEKYMYTIGKDLPLALQMVCQKLYGFIRDPAVLIPLETEEAKRLEQMSSHLHKMIHQDQIPYSDERVILFYGYVLAEITEILKNNPPLHQNSSDTGILDALEYITNHLTEKITLQDIADHVHVGKTKLNADFRKYLSLSVYQYIMQERLILSIDCLQQGLSVEDTAIRCGFADSSHFIHTFRKYYHITPTQYKERLV